MEWVARPVRGGDDRYTLSAKHGTTHYIPDTHVELSVRVHSYDMKYRGLLVDAVNALNETVGRFNFDPSSNMFWEPPACPGALVQTSADPKPFGVTLTWVAPPQGAGPVRFRCLIKRGAANTGSFHYPSTGAGAGAGGQDLVLEEMDMAGEGAPQPVTLAADAGVSCASHCRAELGYACDGDRLAGVNSAEAFAAVIGTYHAGGLGLVVADCAAAAPGVDGRGRRLFQGGAELCPGGVAAAAAACPSVAAEKHCTATHPAIRRFCACVPEQEQEQEQARTRRRRRRASGADGAATSPAARPAARLAAVLLPLLGCASLGQGWAAVLGGVALASLVERAAAHNWMMTPSRVWSLEP